MRLSFRPHAPEPDDPAARVADLPNADMRRSEAGLVTVSPSASLFDAQSLLLLYGFSQLPVVAPGEPSRGVSWRSIGVRTVLFGAPQTVGQASEPAATIALDAPLGAVCDLIIRHEYVLVQDGGELVGIVTPSDLASGLRGRGETMLLLEEIEGRLRRRIARCLDAREIARALPPHRRDEGVEGLTFGGYAQLLEDARNWDRMRLGVERGRFLARLREVGEIRNAAMHFREVDESSAGAALAGFASFLRRLDEFGGDKDSRLTKAEHLSP